MGWFAAGLVPHRTWLAACGALAAIALAVWPAAAREPEQFTMAERRSLALGRLVTRPTEQRRGELDLIGGSAWQVIEAPPDVVLRALLDTQYYTRMLPQVIEARLVKERRSGLRTVFLRQGSGPVNVGYFLTLRTDRERREVRFALDRSRPHELRAAWGFYSVRPYSRGRTLLTYGVMADLGSGLLRSLVRDTVHDWMLRVPWMVKRFVEGSGRWIYDYDPSSLAATAAR